MGYALVSVYDKEGIIEFARFIKNEMNLDIISTGGTAKLLNENGIETVKVSDITNFPEIMDGRVKTLHPLIFGGILGRRGKDDEIMKDMNIPDIKMVVVNLYPFEDKLKEDLSLDEMLEFIDIGGPSMLRASAKNYKDIVVVCDTSDYDIIISEYKEKNEIGEELRKELAAKVFYKTSYYDSLIASYLSDKYVAFHGEKERDLRYGENPHQKSSLYILNTDKYGIKDITQYQGKKLSYNNILDMESAARIAGFFRTPTVAIIKHQNPCGVGRAETINDAYELAYMSDPVSAFGGIIAINRRVEKDLAERIIENFVEVVVAPSFSEESLEIFYENKKRMRVIEWDLFKVVREREFKYVPGGILVQDEDYKTDDKTEWKVVSDREPTRMEWEALEFAWNVVRFVKSNAIVISTPNRTIGIGAGQMSRVDAVELAIKKAQGSGSSLIGTVLASDAFFPFRDSIDIAAEYGITAIIEPGGSIKDKDVIKACNDHDIALVFTGRRHFRH